MPDLLHVDAEVAERHARLRVSVGGGECVAVVGPNGAGKSTLLQLIAGSLRPSAGTVTLRGEVLSGDGVHVPVHRRRFSYVEQAAWLFPHLNVLDNVAFGPRSRGVSKAGARERARRELEAAGVAELGPRRPNTLSGGQAGRVAIARALAIDPEIVLLDEPFAALDARVTPQLRALLRSRLAGRSAVIVTHDLLDVVTLAQRIVVIEDGHVVADGPVDEVCSAPPTGFLAEFVGVNLLHGRAVEGDVLAVAGQRLRGMVDAGRGLSLADGEAAGVDGQPLPALVPGQEARATFAPSAVALHHELPGGSPRNALAVTVTAIEPRGARVAVALSIGHQRLRAELTPQAVAELNLVPGQRLYAVVKAVQVSLHGAAGG